MLGGPITASTTLVDYLSSKGVHTYRSSGDEVTAMCWWCNENRPNKRKLYLNTDSWLYLCMVCGEHGNRLSLLRHFGDDQRLDLRWAPGTDPALRMKALDEGIALAESMLYNNPKVLEYLQGRGLDAQTIVDMRLGYVPTSWGLGACLVDTNARADLVNAGWLTKQGQEFFSGHILIPYISHGHVVQVRGKEYIPGVSEGKYVSTEGDDVRMYGTDTLLGAREVLVVEGEFDQAICRQVFRNSPDAKLREMAVVGLAGAMVLPPNFESLFDDVSRIYLGLDPDETGSKAVERIKGFPGLASKVRVVKLPDALPKCDWGAYLGPRTEKNPHGDHGWQDVLNLIHDAEAEGRVLFSIADAQRQMDKLAKERGIGIPLGFREFDRFIEPGLKPGQIMVPLAATGTGKTSLLASITYNLSDPARTGRQHPMLILSLEMTAVEYYERLRRAALFWHPTITDRQIAELYSKVRIYESTIGPGGTTRMCEEFVADVGEDPEVVMLDYIGYASRRFPGSGQYEKTSNAVMGLKEEAKAGKFGLIAPHQVGRGNEGPLKLDSARDSGVIEETADILVGFYRPGDASRGPGDATVSAGLLKNRNGRNEVTTHFVFSLASLVLVQKGSPEANVVGDENALILRGSKYHEVLEFRRQRALSLGIHQPQLTPDPNYDRHQAFN